MSARVILIRDGTYESPLRRPNNALIYNSTLGLRKATAKFYNPNSLHLAYTDEALGPVYRLVQNSDSAKFNTVGQRSTMLKARCINSDETLNRNPPELVTRLEDQWHNTGENVTLTCAFKGNPTPTVSWFKDQQPLQADIRTLFSYEHGVAQLTLFGATHDQTGLYSCRAENALGCRETICQIYIVDYGCHLARVPVGKILADNRNYRLLAASLGIASRSDR